MIFGDVQLVLVLAEGLVGAPADALLLGTTGANEAADAAQAEGQGKTDQNCIELTPNWAQNWSRWAQGRPSWLQIGLSWLKLFQSWPKLAPSWPKLIPGWPRFDSSWPKLPPNYPKLPSNKPQVSQS